MRLFSVAVFFTLMVGLINASLSVMHLIPDSVLAFMGAHNSGMTFARDANQHATNAGQSIFGTMKAGRAAGLGSAVKAGKEKLDKEKRDKDKLGTNG